MAETTSRIVLVTGAAGGIGRAMVASLLAAGHRIAALDYDAKGLDALLAAHGSHPNLHAIEADLSTAHGCEAGMAAAVSHFGRVEVLVNNAGIGVSSLRPDAETRLPSLEELSAAVWDRFFAINVTAPMLLTRAAVPMMREAGWGRCPSSNHLRPLCTLSNGVSGPSVVKVKLRFGDASSGGAGWFCA